MPGLQQAQFARVLPVLRTMTLPAGNTTTFYLPIVALMGYARGVFSVFTDQPVYLNVFQKPRRLSAASLFTFRQTDNILVPSSGVTQDYEFKVRSDYGQIQIVTTTAPTVFELELTLFPPS